MMQKYSIQLKLADYEMLSLEDASDFPDFQMDELASIPNWVVEAHAESMDSTSLMLANDSHSDDISEDDLPICILNFDVDAESTGLDLVLAAAEAESPIQHHAVDCSLASDEFEKIYFFTAAQGGIESSIPGNELVAIDSPDLPSDHARWTLKQFQKFDVAVTPALKEVANLEADNSMYMSAMEPKTLHVLHAYLTPADMQCSVSRWIVILQWMMKQRFSALMDSPNEYEASIDLESSGSDHQIDNESVRRLKKHYVTTMDKDARDLVMLFPTAESNSIGDLMLSTNADEANSAVDSNFH